MKGFIVKRQAQLTPDHAKHLHFDTPTRGLEADKIVDALNRLDQTDPLVEQILGERAKVVHNTAGDTCNKIITLRRTRWKPNPLCEPSQTVTDQGRTGACME